MALIGPGVLCVFGLAFLWAWAIERKRHYLLLLAAAPCLFALGVMIQVFGWPANTAPNALLSAFFYTSAVLLTAEAILRRSGKRFGLRADAAMLIAVLGGLWYFASVAPNTLVRVYIQNFGYGVILLLAALRLAHLRRGAWGDRALFWMLFAFALHFFPRTILTIGLSAPATASAFGASLFWAALHLSLAVLGAGLALAILAAALSDVIEDLRRERDVDGLTGILNRQGFESRAAAIIAEAGRGSCTLIACDLDHFKQINDRHGHASGDAVLTVFGKLLRLSARATDLVGRLGGEEFAVLLAGATREGAVEFAERLRVELSQAAFEFLPADGRVTASLGIAELRQGESLSQLLARADRRLYRAKAAGRNRTVAGEGPAGLGDDPRISAD
jgi:diguanylate cyclase (GGDEF)-like protein